jgi:GTP-binding protein HflX
VVVLRPGAAVEAAELVALVREAKGPVQAPKSGDFVDALPVTGLGKPDKKALRARYWAGAARGVACAHRLERGAHGGAGGNASGGVGTRGPGETKIETDRRRIRAQMTKLRRELKEMEKSRVTQRASRHRAGIPSVTIAGYTNAGKSSLLNRLTGAGVLVENSLFATLDPTIRKAKSPSGRDFTLADTVGFVRHLPHQLVEAFRSTLEEVKDADLIVHVVDASDEDPEGQINAVRLVLNDVDAGHVPELIVLNKADIADPEIVTNLLRREPHSVVISAKTGEGIDELLLAIEADLPSLMQEVDLVVPYSRGDLISRAHATGDVISIAHDETGTRLHARVPESLANELRTACE